MKVQMMKVGDLREYGNNPRFNDKAVDAVAKSIETFGFKVPLVVTTSGEIICGHTRLKAAKKLELTEIPCIVTDDLTPEKIKAFRLADNKVGELAQWDIAALATKIEELQALGVDDLADYGFDTSEEWWKQAAWKKVESFCNLKKRVRQNSHGDFFSTTFFESNKRGDGENIKAIKEKAENVPIFADVLCDFLYKTLGKNLSLGNWGLMTAPRRRHKDGFHFSTEICKAATRTMNLPFFEDAVTAQTRNRINPDFTLNHNPREVNVILFDDIVSTGETLRTMRQLLIEAGHVVLPIAAIKNQ